MFLVDEPTLSIFPFLIGGMLRGGNLLFVGMSSTNSNSEDYFSDHPKRLPSFDRLLRSEAQLTPEDFFRTLERQSGENHCTEDDYQRAVFLFRRQQSTRWNISKLSLFLVAMSLVPFVCVRLPEEWCLSPLTSGIVLDFFSGAILLLRALTMAGQAQGLLFVVEAGPSTCE
jgi:hypothetical protein